MGVRLILIVVLTMGLLHAGVAAAQDAAPSTSQIAVRREIAAKNANDGDAFLAANKTREGVVTLASGLQYRMLKEGDGKKPALDDIVVCHYRGTLIDGAEFDSSYTRNQPAMIAVKRVIKGWAEALQLMPVGSKWQLFIPSQLAYGARGTRGRIGPNATLIFEVDLVAITGPSGDGSRAYAAPPVTGIKGIQVLYKLDPRLTSGLYMGDRWVSPATYTRVQDGNQLTVEVRAHGLDARGRPTKLMPRWIPTDPEMVTVTPSEGNEVKIAVLRAGESILEVAFDGLSRKLLVRAEYKNGALVGSFTSEHP